MQGNYTFAWTHSHTQLKYNVMYVCTCTLVYKHTYMYTLTYTYSLVHSISQCVRLVAGLLGVTLTTTLSLKHLDLQHYELHINSLRPSVRVLWQIGLLPWHFWWSSCCQFSKLVIKVTLILLASSTNNTYLLPNIKICRPCTIHVCRLSLQNKPVKLCIYQQAIFTFPISSRWGLIPICVLAI